jgi:phosphatidylglycerophosphate synthase
MDKEGPIDIIILTITEWITPLFHATGHTPNLITTYSLLCGLGSAYALWKGYLTLFIVLYMLSYLFDCVDGYMARRYDQMSVFGDYYDHFSDLAKGFAILYVFACKYPVKPLIPVSIGLGILFLGMTVYFGCSQQHINKEESKETLDVLRSLCQSDDTIHIAKYFSSGTFTVGILLAGVYLESIHKQKK